MNITINLSEADIIEAVAQYIRAAGHALDDDSLVELDYNDVGVSASVAIDLASSVTAAAETAEEPVKVKRKRRTPAEMQAARDEEQGIAEAAGAVNAEDKGTPELEAEETTPETETAVAEPAEPEPTETAIASATELFAINA